MYKLQSALEFVLVCYIALKQEAVVLDNRELSFRRSGAQNTLCSNVLK
jgi:hypothetical protein